MQILTLLITKYEDMRIFGIIDTRITQIILSFLTLLPTPNFTMDSWEREAIRKSLALILHVNFSKSRTHSTVIYVC